MIQKLYISFRQIAFFLFEFNRTIFFIFWWRDANLQRSIWVWNSLFSLVNFQRIQFIVRNAKVWFRRWRRDFFILWTLCMGSFRNYWFLTNRTPSSLQTLFTNNFANLLLRWFLDVFVLITELRLLSWFIIIDIRQLGFIIKRNW